MTQLKTAIVLAMFGAVLAETAPAITVVPEGNRHAEQPLIPAGSHNRTSKLKTNFDAKYGKVIALLQKDEDLREKITEVAAAYEIDPIHIAGAIIGEHTYNVDVYDRLQTYYVKAISYLGSDLSFEFEGETIGDFVERPEFDDCAMRKDSYDLWVCREEIWNTVFRGKTVGETRFPDDRFSAVFFQPFYAGQTFGIGQLNPLTALQMSDMVNTVSGLPKLEAKNAKAVYNTIMDPDLTLPYVAATIRKAIDSYKEIAGFDISGNPGITATLYNLGDPVGRALALRAENRKSLDSGGKARMPEENYYGWLVNHRLGELRALF